MGERFALLVFAVSGPDNQYTLSTQALSTPSFGRWHKCSVCVPRPEHHKTKPNRKSFKKQKIMASGEIRFAMSELCLPGRFTACAWLPIFGGNHEGLGGGNGRQ